MSFLTPLFLLLGLLAGPIILLYMLRLRRREVPVSSTLLWRKLLRDREANAPWQRLRRNLLLLLQLLILAALVIALARPFVPVRLLASGNIVVLLDGSASMQATDVPPTRFAAARAEVEALIADLGGNDQMTLIKVGRTPTVLLSASNDRSRLRQALATAQVESAAADWAAAMALAAGAAQGFREARVVVVSDGGLPETLPPLPAELIYVPIGNSGENLAITALATRTSSTGPQLFASVRNEGLEARTALLSLSLEGVLFDSRRLMIPAGGSADTTWDLPPNAAVIEARLSDHTGDHLPLDDIAWAVHEGGGDNRALLVTEGNLFLEQVYAVLPGVEAFKAPADTPLLSQEALAEPFDLYVFDGTPWPEPLPAADILIVNPDPAASGELLTVSGTFSDTVAIRLADSPLLQFVDWRNVHVRQARQVEAAWATPLVEGAGGALVLAGERQGHRIAIITFDLRDSDLPLQIAFPVLMANITSWLNPGRAFDAPTGLQPGDPVGISPAASTTAVHVRKPDGAIWTRQAAEAAVLFTETDMLGIYQVRLQDQAGEQAAGRFAVNLFAPSESRIAPADSLTIGQTTVETALDRDVGQRELWPWLVALAALVLILEWWVHHRGTQLPGRRLS